MNIFILIVSIPFIMTLFTLNAVAESIHLDRAMQHAEAATKAENGKAVAEHAAKAKIHAKAAKYDAQHRVDGGHVNEGIESLNNAIKEGNERNTDIAQKAARIALNHFNQATK